jgi:hypothetical protein
MAELLARLRRFGPIFDARPQSPPALAGFLAFGLAPNLQRQIYILNRHNAQIYAVAWRLGAKGGLPRKLRLQLRAPRRCVGRPPLPRLLAGIRHKIGAFSNFQGLAAILAVFFMRRAAAPVSAKYSNLSAESLLSCLAVPRSVSRPAAALSPPIPAAMAGAPGPSPESALISPRPNGDRR